MFEKHTLKNGLRIVLAPLHDTEVVTILIMFKVGSRYEDKNINGISHFLEHLFFKGTKRRPSTLEISKTLDGVGAEYNAFTGKDSTGYYIKLQYKKFELALDMLSDMLVNSLFDPAEVERERNVIIEEINMYDDNPSMMVEEYLERLLYGATPMGFSIAGPRQTIRKIKREQILTFRQSHYHAGNTIVAVAGRLPQNASQLVRKYFGGNRFPKQKALHYLPPRIAKNSGVFLKYKKTEQVHVALGWPAYDYTHKDAEALRLLMTILGGNMSSRLFISIRERRGLCYFIRGSLTHYEDAGNVVIQSGIDRRRIYEALKAILSEIRTFCETGPAQEEIAKAKEYIKGKLLLELEDSESLASWMVRHELFFPKIETPKEYFSRLEKVTLSDVLRVARDVFRFGKTQLAVIGPFRQKELFRKTLLL